MWSTAPTQRRLPLRKFRSFSALPNCSSSGCLGCGLGNVNHKAGTEALLGFDRDRTSEALDDSLDRCQTDAASREVGAVQPPKHFEDMRNVSFADADPVILYQDAPG